MLTDYTILQASNSDEMGAMVKQAMTNGFNPLGEVIISSVQTPKPFMFIEMIKGTQDTNLNATPDYRILQANSPMEMVSLVKQSISDGFLISADLDVIASDHSRPFVFKQVKKGIADTVLNTPVVVTPVVTIPASQTITGTNAEPYTEYSRSDITNEKWSIGRVAVDASSSQFKIVHTVGTVDTVVASFKADNSLQLNGLLRLLLASEQTYGSDGAVYVRSDTKLLGLALGGAYHYIGWGTKAPTTGGPYKLGDIIFNSTPAALGSIGWTCITAGSPGIWKSFGALGL